MRNETFIFILSEEEERGSIRSNEKMRKRRHMKKCVFDN
jgi:hypothetical protein